MGKEPMYPHVPGGKGYLLTVELSGTDKDYIGAENLAKQAAEDLHQGRMSSALWRLVDAAGMISQHIPGTGLIGRDHMTGRGYQIISDREWNRH